MLKLSLGRARFKLNKVAASPLNRFGDDTSSKHCIELGRVVHLRDGFAEYRYLAGLLHYPDPNNPKHVYDHNMAMRELDKDLPELEDADLDGVFGKTHLTTMMQMALQGGRFIPGEPGGDADIELTTKLGNDEAHDVRQGSHPQYQACQVSASAH